MTVYDDVCDYLQTNGRIVNTRPQEKQLIGTRELIVVVVDMDIDVESTVTYMNTVTCAIIWNETHGGDVLSSVPKMMKDIEENVTIPCKFKFLKPDIRLLGTAYQVTMRFGYTEVVKIE